MTQKSDPLGKNTTYTYDALGRPATCTDALGTVRSFQYDAVGQIIRMSSGADTLNYDYDAVGRLTSTQGLEKSYDAAGRVTRCVSGQTTYDLTWNSKGQLVAVTLTPGGLTITYAYDPTTGRIASVSDSENLGSADFTYDAAGRVTAISRKNGISSTFSYDPGTGQITGLREGDFTDLNFTLDSLGRVTALNGTLPLEPGEHLTSLDESHTVNAMDQITDTGYSYDAAGRLLTTPDLSLTWNGFSRLTGINDAVYTYDGLSRILSSILEGTTTHYSYCDTVGGQIPLRIHNNDLEWIQVSVPGWGLVYSISKTSGGESVAYYHTDRRGSTLAVTDPAGEVTHRFAYTPYGRLLADASNPTDSCPPFLFLGHYGCHTLPGTDALYRHGARAYLPAVGQFVSPEPQWPDITDPARLNIYNYAASDPVNYVDFNGLMFSLNTNMSAIQTSGQLQKTQFNLSKTFERLLRRRQPINHVNDAVGIQKGQRLTARIKRFHQNEGGLKNNKGYRGDLRKYSRAKNEWVVLNASTDVAPPDRKKRQLLYQAPNRSGMAVESDYKEPKEPDWIAEAKERYKNRYPANKRIFSNAKNQWIELHASNDAPDHKKKQMLNFSNPALQRQNSCGGTQVPVFKR